MVLVLRCFFTDLRRERLLLYTALTIWFFLQLIGFYNRGEKLLLRGTN
jgi:hypothetical protein